MGEVVAAQGPAVRPIRKRPFIYVYNLDPHVGTDMLAYRIDKTHCVYRWGVLMPELFPQHFTMDSTLVHSLCGTHHVVFSKIHTTVLGCMPWLCAVASPRICHI